MKVEAAILGFTIVITACGLEAPPTEVSKPSFEPEAVKTSTVALPTPGPTPTRVPIGVIEGDRAGLYPRSEPEEGSPWGDDPQPDSDGVYRFVVDGKVTQPILKEKGPSALKEFAGKQVQGSVIVAETVIKEDGTVGDIKLLRGVDPEIDQAFLDSLKQYIFEPATLDGKPVPIRYIHTLRIHVQ